MDNWPFYCARLGCGQDTIHERLIWLAKVCGVASFALALVLYLVFRQHKLLLMPLLLGGCAYSSCCGAKWATRCCWLS